ncbi:aminotransferase class V-fold PLP-dependent enzyme [Williamsia sp.]|uniref:aminotransferase class V-fold PLP-dependent enzyme n=1 Tax=Williamsia sp. TaxID=1872085 RepID=UPI002F948424
MTSSSTSDFRVEIARIVKARPTDRVLPVSDLAEAVALVSDAAPGDVLTLDLTADLASGARRVVPAQIDLSTTLAAVDSELERRPAALLIVPAVAKATGEVLPLAALAAIAHRRGGRILVDASEILARRAVNLTSHGIDYLVWSGPSVAGSSVAGPAVVVGRADWLADTRDPTHGGTALPLARDLIPEHGYEWAGLHEQALSDWLDDEIGRFPGIRRLQLWTDARDRVGIASLAVAGHSEPVAVRWDAATGIEDLARQLNSLAENVLEQEKS